MAFSTGSLSSSEINVTPLIDVLLVLLIIFMVIVPNAQHGLETSLPPASPQRVTGDVDQPVVIQVRSASALGGADADSHVCVNGSPARDAALDQVLRSAFRTHATRQAIVKADSDLEFGSVENVVDRARSAGAAGVALGPAQHSARCLI